MKSVHRIFVLSWTFLTSLLVVVMGEERSIEVPSIAYSIAGPAMNFTWPPESQEYQSSAVFDPRGMEHLYIVTDLFLSLVQQEGLPEVILNGSVNSLEAVEKNAPVLWSHYKVMLVLVMTGIVLAVLVPVIGLFFCCCRLCGKCGGRKNVPEKSGDKCKRIFCGLLMFFVVVSMLFALVCAFVTNEYVKQGIRDLPAASNKTVTDIHLYVNNTRLEVNYLLNTNYGELQARLNHSLDKCGDIVRDEFGNVSNAVSIKTLSDVVSRLNQILDNLVQVQSLTTNLQNEGSILKNNLRQVKSDIMTTVNRCNSETCKVIKNSNEFKTLKVTNDYVNLPNVSGILNTVDDLLKQNINLEVKKGLESFSHLNESFQKQVDSSVRDAKKKIADIGRELSLESDKYDKQLKLGSLDDVTHEITKFVQEHERYFQYRYYVNIGVCCVLLVILTCFTLGLSWGACGQRPGSLYSDSSCSKSTGAKFMLWAVFFVFFLYLFMQVITSAMFLVGGVVQRGVCDVVTDVSNPKGKSIVDWALKGTSLRNSSVTEYIARCNSNPSLYELGNLKNTSQLQFGPVVIASVNFSDIRNYRNKYGIDEKLNEILSELSLNSNVTLLTDSGEALLKQLNSTSFSALNFTRYLEVIDMSPVSANLQNISDQLKKSAMKIQSHEPEISEKLKESAAKVEKYNENILSKINLTLEQLRVHVKHLENLVYYDKRTLIDVVSEQYKNVQKAQDFIKNKGQTTVRMLAEEFVKGLSSLIDQYINYTQHQVEEEVGRCKPLSQAYNASITAVCKEIVLPFNGYWVSVGWCCLVSLIGLILAVYLASLYRRVDPYTGPLLDSVNRKRRHGGRGVYENRNGYLHDYSPEYRNDRIPSPGVAYMPAPRYDYSRESEVELPAYNGSKSPPSAPQGDLSEWTLQAGFSSHPYRSSSPNEFSKPPPYYYPGP